MTLRDLAAALRVEHWVKNLFLFIPAFFAGNLFNFAVFGTAFLGFVAFCLISSSVYILNDSVDRAQDQHHPDKKKRPIASGAISLAQARWIFMVVFLSGFALAFSLNIMAFYMGGLYFIINVFYSFWLKHIAIIDISLIGMGFLTRIFAGAEFTGVAVSQWLIVLTFLLAMILGLAKRRGEYLLVAQGGSFRKALEGYNLPFLDMAMVVCSTVSIVAYLMYCFSPEVIARIGSPNIYFTSLFVILGVLRYLQLTLVYNKTESPVRALLRDSFLQIILIGWIACFAWLLYLKPAI